MTRPEVKKNDLLFATRARSISCAALLYRQIDENFKFLQQHYRSDQDKMFRFEQPYALGDYVSVDRRRLILCAAKLLAAEGN